MLNGLSTGSIFWCMRSMMNRYGTHMAIVQNDRIV